LFANGYEPVNQWLRRPVRRGGIPICGRLPILSPPG
jgi:hypothetical protein